MPYVKRPTNDSERIGVLTVTRERHHKNPENEASYLPDELVQKITNLLPNYQEDIANLNEAEADRSEEIDQKNAAYIAVQVYLRDLWATQKRRVSREKLPVKVLTYYGLPESGIIPKTNATQGIISTAQAVVDGDARAVAAGYQPAANPSAAELAEMIAIALDEMGDVGMADAQVNAVQEKLAEMRSIADELIDDIIAELEFRLRKLPEPDQRRIMRSYGIRFASNENVITEE